jgi:hypothetical protein
VRVRVPADVDMADRIFAGLTARQLAILGGNGLLLLVLYVTLGERIPLPLLGVVAVPVSLLGLLWATTSAEGTTWERIGVAALRHFARPRRRVLAPEGIPEPPTWAGEIGALAPLEFPAQGASPDGHVDLGDEGAAAICRASSVNFALRSETEQRALVEGFARLPSGSKGRRRPGSLPRPGILRQSHFERESVDRRAPWRGAGEPGPGPSQTAHPGPTRGPPGP